MADANRGVTAAQPRFPGCYETTRPGRTPTGMNNLLMFRTRMDNEQ